MSDKTPFPFGVPAVGMIGAAVSVSLKAHQRLTQLQCSQLEYIKNLSTGERYTHPDVRAITDRTLEILRTPMTRDLDAAWTRARHEFDAAYKSATHVTSEKEV